MRFRKFVFIIALLSAGRSWAQDSLHLLKRPEQTIEFSGLGYMNSTTINNDIIKAFYFGRFIDEDMKFSSSRKMEESNILGGMSRIGFSYSWHSAERGNKPVFSFSLYDRTHIDLKFSNDLFNVLFYGNKMYEGRYALLGDFYLNFLRYQQARFGWNWQGDAAHGSYGFAFSLLSGEQNMSVAIPMANLFTAEDGTYLDFNVSMNVDRTDTAHSGYFAQNGTGLSTDFFYEVPYTFRNKPGRIRFDVKDLGFIRWNSNSMHYAADSAWHYEGVDVTDLFNLDSTVSPFNIDRVIDNNTAFRHGPYHTCIPGSIDVHTKVFYGKQLAVEKGITWRFSTHAHPYYYAKLHFLLGRAKTTDVAYVIGFGGYGRFNSGVDITAELGKHYSLQFMNYYLFSDVTVQSNTGMGAYVKLIRKF